MNLTVSDSISYFFLLNRDELLAYPIGWSTLSQHNILSEVMNTWVSKKITEHLGEEEPSLVEFIMGESSF